MNGNNKHRRGRRRRRRRVHVVSVGRSPSSLPSVTPILVARSISTIPPTQPLCRFHPRAVVWPALSGYFFNCRRCYCFDSPYELLTRFLPRSHPIQLRTKLLVVFSIHPFPLSRQITGLSRGAPTPNYYYFLPLSFSLRLPIVILAHFPPLFVVDKRGSSR